MKGISMSREKIEEARGAPVEGKKPEYTAEMFQVRNGALGKDRLYLPILMQKYPGKKYSSVDEIKAEIEKIKRQEVK